MTPTTMSELIERLERWLGPKADDETRCAICGWPLADVTGAWCVRGNCSSRPLPQRWYAPERAKREYGPYLVEPTLAPLTFSLSGDEASTVLAALRALPAAPCATDEKMLAFRGILEAQRGKAFRHVWKDDGVTYTPYRHMLAEFYRLWPELLDGRATWNEPLPAPPASGEEG